MTMENMIGTDRIIEYSELLKVYGMSYTPVGLYWQVGEIELTQGWILHVSATSFQFQPLLEKLIPALLDQKVPFRIVRDAILAGSLAEGGLGYAILGKMVSVYPENDRQAVALAKKLIELTAGYRGPAIPTDRHLGGTVYTRYGSFNPVMIKSPQGEWVKHIYNAKGQLVADPYEIPFRVPEGQVWPFGEIADPEPPKAGKLMNYKYYPLLVMKPDAKGDVMKGLYFRKLWQIRSCIIKEGRANMFTDEYGRDIRDRLKWQYKLYKALHKDIPMPEVFDYFEIQDNVYLVMEFIKGQPLSTWYAAIYRDRSWHDLDSSQRLQLLDQLLRIISFIERMHQKGYVHRDITPENFLLDAKGNICLIDMELTWYGLEDPRQPPYKLGTAGHMSPEQQKGLTPTAKEDIYALGSIIATFLANLYALKITGQSGEQVRKGLDVLTGEPLIGALVAACWEVDPAKRPTLAYLTDQLRAYKGNLSKGLPVRNAGTAPIGKPGNSILRTTIQSGLNFLGAPVLLNQQHVWISVSKQKEVHIGNPQESIEVYEGWHTGMAGPLWLVARAKSMGFSIDGCRLPYISSWEFIDSHHFGDETAMSPGLYGGSAGIALALAEGMSSGLLEPNEGNRERLRACFASVARTPELSAGMAGQGLALLRCGPWLDKGWVGERIAQYAISLMKMQQPGGGWN
ncbi:MAG TPA: protein kinase, partial [Puia sp.]|nr:protein kinase [Puia sp.]